MKREWFIEDDRERAAFHEAGHVVRAWCLHEGSVQGVRVHNDSAEVTVNLAGFSAEEKTTVAVAGALSEARSVGQLGDGWLPVAARMTCHHYFRHHEYPGQLITVSLNDGNSVDVSFSDEDFFQIDGDFHGNSLKLEEVIRDTVQWLDQDWASVEKVANQLLENDELTGDALADIL